MKELYDGGKRVEKEGGPRNDRFFCFCFLFLFCFAADVDFDCPSPEERVGVFFGTRVRANRSM